MNYLSETGLKLLNEVITTNGYFPNAKYQLQMDVNGETIFMSDNYIEELTHTLEATPIMSTIKFSIHCEEMTLGVTLNPLEHLNKELSNTIIETISRKLINVQINNNCVVNSQDFERMLSRTLWKSPELFPKTLNGEARISVDPLCINS